MTNGNIPPQQANNPQQMTATPNPFFMKLKKLFWSGSITIPLGKNKKSLPKKAITLMIAAIVLALIIALPVTRAVEKARNPILFASSSCSRYGDRDIKTESDDSNYVSIELSSDVKDFNHPTKEDMENATLFVHTQPNKDRKLFNCVADVLDVPDDITQQILAGGETNSANWGVFHAEWYMWPSIDELDLSVQKVG
ncbi:MAG: hypothetical protein LKJ44_00435 [Bifidobacteriaceae bacterium]|jgi:hypothetical protein|nr:hypothetical protein [Bifidobacteriaceae bacterium]MCI1978175.1 hypothetical protein [Bifidobacteriaceae bacterium]